MKITSVNVRKVEKEGSRMKGSATIVLDDMVAIHDIRIIDGDKGLFIAMPSRKTKTGSYRDIAHPITQEVRTTFEKEILDAYEKAEDYVPDSVVEEE
ncbi:MAG: septation regulator SpoVG [Bacilli bacterium]